MLLSASNSVTGAAVIAGIKARIEAVYTNGPVRVVVTPNPTGPDYVAQEGVTIRVPVAEPNPLSGAGRAGFVVHRRVAVYVVTANLLDEAGSDEQAAYAHMTLEETVADAVHDLVDASTTRLGIKVRWVPGGAEIARGTKQDPALRTSVLLFDVEYPMAFRVNRT